MNKPIKTNIRTFVRFNNRTFECRKYTFVPALVLYHISFEAEKFCSFHVFCMYMKVQDGTVHVWI